MGKFFKVRELEIGGFTDDEIKEILTTSLGIKNSDFLDRIAKVAKGNARLAILAGKHSVDKGLSGIKNALDIFHSYYGDILRSQELDQTSISTLFIIAFLGKVQIENNEFSNHFLSYFNISNERFLQICHELNEKELVDLFHDEVAQISDQSLSNYIIEYVLIEKKSIRISQILDIGFPKISEKIIYNLNTLISLFNSEEISDYIIAEINSSWKAAEADHQSSYLESFYSLNEEKALMMIKKEIELLETTSLSLTDFDFNKGKNNRNINTSILNILGGFKYSEYLADAISLLLALFKKKPDLVMEFYWVFSEKFSFDERSHSLDYEIENALVETLWSHYENNKDDNLAILLVQVFKGMLNCSIQKTKSGDDYKTIQMISFSVVFSEGTRRLRKSIWKNLSDLYSSDLHKSVIEAILSEFHGQGMEKEQFREILSFDLNCIEELFIREWEIITFSQAKVLKLLFDYGERIECDLNESFKRYYENSKFRVYDVLTEKRIKKKTWEETEAEREKEIIAYTRLYSDEDYINLFEFLGELKSDNSMEYNTVGGGVRFLFSSLSEKKFIGVLRIYLSQNAPYSGGAKYIILAKLLDTINFYEAKNLIESYSFDKKREWLNWLWQIVPETHINSAIAEEFMAYFKEEMELESPLLPSIINLERYVHVRPGVISEVSELIIEIYSNNDLQPNDFLGGIYEDEYVIQILELYADNIDILKKLYILCNKDHFDYKGNLFMSLLRDDYVFWAKYLESFSCEHSGMYESYTKHIFKEIWLRDDYYQLIMIAFNTFFEGEFWYIQESKISTVFPHINNMERKGVDNQLTWIDSYTWIIHLTNTNCHKAY